MKAENIKKPNFDIEVKAEIKGIAKIEDNINEVNEMAIAILKYYETTVFSDEDMKTAKDEKANINKFKAKVKEFKKNILEEYNKPISAFDEKARNAIKTLEEAYDKINEQVAKYEDKLKKEKEEEVKAYFEEYQEDKNIEFIKYENAKINVTLSASMKGLKEEAKSFIDKIESDLILIDTQEYKTDILVEYKATLNVSEAITKVSNRYKAIEEEKARQEELAQKKAEAQQVEAQIAKVATVSAPKKVVKEEKHTAVFTVTDTKDRLIALREFLKVGGYEYDQE